MLSTDPSGAGESGGAGGARARTPSAAHVAAHSSDMLAVAGRGGDHEAQPFADAATAAAADQSATVVLQASCGLVKSVTPLKGRISTQLSPHREVGVSVAKGA
eukprot:7385315-Prymnesium_polylepis.1